MGVDGEFDAFAVLVRRSADLRDLVESLADRLGRALPDQVAVERSGLLSGRHLERLSIDFGARRLVLRVTSGRPAALVEHVVREVCVRTDEVTIDEWLEQLGAALEREAAASTTVRLALEEALR